MSLPYFSDTPFLLQLSFAQPIEQLEKNAADPASENPPRAQQLLQEINRFPELREGLTDRTQLTQHAHLIKSLMADYFPPALGLNEIKAVTIPYTNIIFNRTERFLQLMNAAGPTFEINIRNFDAHQFYIRSCCLILNEFYGTRLDFSHPLFYDIPTADGVIKHYRILYNGDFIDIVPTEKAIPLSQQDIDHLLDNYENIALWKEKFPSESWILKGFGLMTLFDVTVENAVSILKEKLLGRNSFGFRDSIESIFRSIYRIPDIRVGFTVYNQEDGQFSPDTFGQQLVSYILPENDHLDAKYRLCLLSYHNLIERRIYFAVSDTPAFLAAYPASPLARHFMAQNIHSFILAPVVKNDRLFGILEIVSYRTKELNSINANKLAVVMPFLTDTIERLNAELQNQVQALIQDSYTTIHPSVYWRFRAEARRRIYDLQIGKDYTLKEVLFPDVHPLYGQIDIKGSSEARNQSVQKDLLTQLNVLLPLLSVINEQNGFPFQDEETHLRQYHTEVTTQLKAGTEQYIHNYISTHIHPRLQETAPLNLQPAISDYFQCTDRANGDFHTYRRKYDTTITIINERMAAILDSRQKDAQNIFPHYYERFKTDGVEHNLYMGPSISPQLTFTTRHLCELRAWQLRVLCEMANAHFLLKPTLPYPLDVTTLVLGYHAPIDIRFRMDEKRFDIDGSYNARYEIVKKRIDKAVIKGTTERITQPDKITIVFSNEEEGLSYLSYIRELQADQLLESPIEEYEVEDLQGVAGLKILRARIAYPNVEQ